MFSALKSWWTSKSKGSKIAYLVLAGVTVLMIVYVIVYSVISSGDPASPFAVGVQLSRPFVGGWDDVFPRILGSLYYICLFMAINFVLRGLIFVLFITANNKVKTVSKLVSSAIKYGTSIAVLFIILSDWGVPVEAQLTTAGILALIIGLGAQSLISDIIAGINIVFESEFHVGDIVLIDGFRGSVSEIGLTTTKIIDVSGNVKIINNSKIATVVNLSANSSVVVAEIGMDYGEDLRKVEEIIENNLGEIEKRNPVFIGRPVYLGVAALADSSVVLKFSARCEEGNRFAAERALNRELFLLFVDNGITIPFPQVTLSNREENK